MQLYLMKTKHNNTEDVLERKLRTKLSCRIKKKRQAKLPTVQLLKMCQDGF